LEGKMPMYAQPEAIYFAVAGRYNLDVPSCLARTGQVNCLARFVFFKGHRLGFVPLLRSFVLGKKLYVGNLGYGVTSSDLEGLLTSFGTVQSAEIIADRDSGRSKGFGFVEMSTDQEAQAAIQGLNGQEHDGRALTVNEARPREERSGGGGRGGYGGGGGGRGGHGGGGGRGGRGGRY
jgi:hypothetical protein